MDAKTFTPSNQRILDLLRYARQELYMANLLSDEEYFEIATDHPAVERLESYDAARKRIRELEAELQVRDDMGDEVLRILREATGKRDFHSEMEAAEYAAKIIRGSGWRPIAEAPEWQSLIVGVWGERVGADGATVSHEWFVEAFQMKKDEAIREGYTHYLPEPEPPAREVENG